MGNLMKNGVSYTGSMLGGSTKTFKGILEAGETSISFVDTLITGNSTIDYETSKLGVNPTNIEVANNAVTLTFAAQAEDIGIRVTISNDAAEPAPTKMRFLKATENQYITLPFYGNEDLTFDFYANLYGASNERIILGDNSWSPSGYILHTWGTTQVAYRPLGYYTISNFGSGILHFTCSDKYLSVNEISYSFDISSSKPHNQLYLFGSPNGHYLNGSLSRMKIYKLGNLVMDLLPTKVGGEACYYDLIGKKAYFSETSTPFQLEEIEYEPTPCISVTNRNTTTTIPMKFTTGNENYVLKTKLYLSSTFVNNNPAGTMYLGTEWNGGGNLIGTDSAGSISIYPDNKNAINLVDIKDRWIDIEINQAEKYAKFDGITYNNTWVNSQNYFSFYGKSNSGVPAFYGAIQIYKDNELVANLIPSVNSNGVGYFHDTITQNDYMSTGSQSFGYACF